MKTCATEGCTKQYRSRGLCSTHYNQQYQPNRHKKVAVTCAQCGAETIKQPSSRYAAQFCSMLCRDAWRRQQGVNPFPPVVEAYAAKYGQAWIGIPAHASLTALRRIDAATKAARAAAAPTPPQTVRFISCYCEWCGDPFIFDIRVTGVVAKCCSDRCSKSRSKAKAKAARGAFAPSKTQRLRIYERDDWTCQLCFGKVDMEAHYLDDWAPSLDHIEPQSRTLIPNHTDANLRTAHRWCNAVRGDGTWHRDLFEISPAA